MRVGGAAVILLVCLGGCSLVRSPLTGARDAAVDAARVEFDADLDASTEVFDAGVDDASSGDVGGDASLADVPLDAGPRDSGLDAQSLDAGPPDTGVDAGPSTPCGARFGAARGYVECTPPSPGLCRFFADPASPTTCDALCATAPGGTCVSVYDDRGLVCASPSGGIGGGCSRPLDQMICLCTMGS